MDSDTHDIPATDSATDCDVLVIGGGPAGAAAAALLARQGRNVVLVEKDRHPRFHIGESLLPASVALLEQLGVREQIERIGMPKFGVEFVSPDHEHQTMLEFCEAWNKSMPSAWQVRRADFDEILFRHAGSLGAQTHEDCRVREVHLEDDGVHVIATQAGGATRRWRAQQLLDASGRDTFLASALGAKRKNPRHNSAALFGHYTGARRHAGRMAGHISIFWFKHGWFWFIPLADGSTSIGAVCWPRYLKTRNSKPLPEFFADTIALCPSLAERLQGATLIDDKVHATGNYSYSADHSSGERYLLLGDAYAFVDPVFSSGVHFAIASAFFGAEVVAARLDGKPQAAALQRGFDERMRKGPREFSWFILRMTNPAMRQLFMHPRNPARMKEALLSLLAGDIYGKTPIWVSLTLFKAVYYANVIAGWRSNWAAWRLRRRNIADVGALEGENILVER